MAGQGHNILRRKLATSKAAVVAGGPGADRCWRVAVARAVRDKLQSTVDFRALTVDKRSLAEIIELIPTRAMIAVLDGPLEGLGLIALDPQITGGFIEAQTVGKVKSSILAARKTTRTDAAMVAGVIDAALTGLELALADEADLVWAGGFRYASFLDDPRPLGLLLEDIPYRVLRAEIDLGGGARRGEILLALPAEGRGAAATTRTNPATNLDTGHAFVQELGDRVNGAHCRIEAVLSRLTMTLSDVLQLTEGMVLALPQASLSQVSLEGSDGRRVGEGKLGQNRGMRAVRLGAEGQDTASPSAERLTTARGPDLGPLANPAFDPDDAALSGGFPAMDFGDMMFQATGTD